MARPRIVIVGAGFVGCQNARTPTRLVRHEAEGVNELMDERLSRTHGDLREGGHAGTGPGTVQQPQQDAESPEFGFESAKNQPAGPVKRPDTPAEGDS